MPRHNEWRTDNPELAKRLDREWRARNPEAARAKGRRWRARQDKQTLYACTRRYSLRKQYGITEDDYNLLADYQHDKCAICETPLPRRTKRGLYVDHCHESMRVRGLLCVSCNGSLERLERIINWNDKALAYLADPPGYSVLKPKQLELVPIERRGRLSPEARQRISNSLKGRKVSWGDKLAASLRKLSQEQVAEIQKRLSPSLGESVDAAVKKCATEFGVSQDVIRRVKAGKYFERWPNKTPRNIA